MHLRCDVARRWPRCAGGAHHVVGIAASKPAPAGGRAEARREAAPYRSVDGVAEISTVVLGQYRVQALAVRLRRRRDGRWQVTALEAG